MMGRLLDGMGEFFFGRTGESISKWGMVILSVLAVVMLAGRWF